MSFFKKNKTEPTSSSPKINEAGLSAIPDTSIEVYQDKDETTLGFDKANGIEEEVPTAGEEEDAELEALRQQLANKEAELAIKKAKKIEVKSEPVSEPAVEKAPEQDLAIGMDSEELKLTSEQLLAFAENMEQRLQKIESFLFRGLAR